jgi:hypothetical protein
VQIKSLSGKKDLAIIYPGVMLNVMVAKHCTNDQYQDLVDPVAKTYKTSSQMSIEFEVDGPYKVPPPCLPGKELSCLDCAKHAVPMLPI